jgi:hypothetical protein
MRCNKCNTRLADHDLWCVECGTQSPVIKAELSAMKSLGRTRTNLNNKISEMVPASGFSIILGVIPIALLSWIFHNYIHALGTAQMLLNLGIKSLMYSLFVPFLILPFTVISGDDDYVLKLRDLIAKLRNYPRYFLFCLLNSIFFVAIYLICFGFPGFASDPILRLVWIVLLNYWAAIVLPVPIIMERKQLNPLKAMVLSYRHFHDVRWNIYLLALVLGLLNLLAFALAIFPLLFTLPLSYFAIRDYIKLLEEYEMLEYRI